MEWGEQRIAIPLFESAGMQSEPLVSVITPAYQAAETLPRALASLVAQSYSRWECVVVDVGSHESTQRVRARVRDARLRH